MCHVVRANSFHTYLILLASRLSFILMMIGLKILNDYINPSRTQSVKLVHLLKIFDL